MSYITETSPAGMNTKGYQQLTSITTSTALTVPAGAHVCWLQAEAVDVRMRDGDAPTASVGMLLKAGANPIPFVGELDSLRFIETATGAILNVLYFASSGN